MRALSGRQIHKPGDARELVVTGLALPFAYITQVRAASSVAAQQAQVTSLHRLQRTVQYQELHEPRSLRLHLLSPSSLERVP